MLSSNYLTSLNRNLNNMQKYQSQLSSGKEINKPSDNPYKTSRIMKSYGELSKNDQYKTNIDDVSNWLNTTDTSLNQAGNVLARIRELQVNAGNATYGGDELIAIKDEVSEKVNELSQILNTNFDGNYIFGGTKSTSKPVIVDSTTGKITYARQDGTVVGSAPAPAPPAPSDADILNQIGADLNAEISQGVITKYNVTAKDVLEYTDKTGTPQNVMDLLKNITNGLNTVPPTTVTGVCLDQMDAAISNLLSKRSQVGAMQNRIDSAQLKNSDETLNMKDILSKTEDIDFAQKTMEYSVMQTVYTASLQVSSKVLPLTLMDYMR
jgi:flagellar hook-associated protein 3 FlgL